MGCLVAVGGFRRFNGGISPKKTHENETPTPFSCNVSPVPVGCSQVGICSVSCVVTRVISTPAPPPQRGKRRTSSQEKTFVDNISRVRESENWRENRFFAAFVPWEQPLACPFARSSIILTFPLLTPEVHDLEKREIIRRNVFCSLNVTFNAVLHATVAPARSCTVRFEGGLLFG